MDKNIKSTLEFLKLRYLYYYYTRSFNRRYKNVNTKLFNNNIDKEVVKKYKEKWSVFGVPVEIKTFMLCSNLSGKIDYNIIPENIFSTFIESRLNPDKELSFFGVKNMYEKWFNYNNIFPKSFLHKINNIYYDSNMELILDIEYFLDNSNFTFPMIIKPSKDSYGGAGVEKVNDFNEFLNKMQSGKNLVFQELISQHKYLNTINVGINSVRTCLYRNNTGEFVVLNNSIRFGINGGLDNLSAGGIVCNIHNDGTLNDYAVDKFGNKYFKHPNTQFEFKDAIIPNYIQLNKKALTIGNLVPFCKLLSLDMCLDENNEWRCIEINTEGQTIRFAQYAGKGFFGKYTDEVISFVTK